MNMTNEVLSIYETPQQKDVVDYNFMKVMS